MKQTFTVVVVREANGEFSAVFPFHNVATSGATREEALENARGLIQMQLDGMAEDGDELYLHLAQAQDAQLVDIETELSDRVAAVAAEQASRWISSAADSQRKAS